MAITDETTNAKTVWLDEESDEDKLQTVERYINLPQTSKAITIKPFSVRIKNSAGRWEKI